ncbi:MAG: hypothetical protein ACMXX8_02285 [Candidatus Woesearchaeota archaeon]
MNTFIKQQQKIISQLEKEVEKNKLKSELVYLNYEKINSLLKEINQNKK